jgi:hypothetical protein
MFRKTTRFLVLFAAMAYISLAVGIAAAATITPAITYQGKLTNAAGSPLTGTYTATFRLYDVSTGGTALATLIQDVTAANGVFTTQLTFNPAYFDGRALWLGVKVGSDAEMTPRQEIRPVPYALGLRPGGSIDGAGLVNTRMLTAFVSGDDSHGFDAYTSGHRNTGFTAAISGDDSRGVYVTNTGNNGDGIRTVTGGSNSPGMSIRTDGLKSYGVLSETSGDGSFGVLANTSGWGAEAVRAYTTGERSGALYGNAARDIGVYGYGKTGGVYGESTGAGAAGIYGKSTDAPGVKGHSDTAEGVLGESDSGYGVIGTSSNNIGVRGEGAQYGIWAQSTGGTGVYGSSNTSYGVHGDSISSYGVVGESQSGTGIKGVGKEGGYFTSTQGGWMYHPYPAVNVTTFYQQNPGIHIHTDGLASEGIGIFTKGEQGWGLKINTTGWRYALGIEVQTDGLWSPGIRANTTGQESTAVAARAYGPASQGVYAYSAQSQAIDADTGNVNHEWALLTDDYIYAGGIRAPDIDLAEYMPAAGNLSPGTVLIIGPDGTLRISAKADDTRVAGIVSTSPAIILGRTPDGNNGEAVVAISGRVPCKVDAGYGSIRPGDLLSTSDTPGHAMKARPVRIGDIEFYRDGTVLGKAMGSLESGTGTIEVLVTLQ